MKHTVKNLTNSPYDVATVDGHERIPARGELTAEFDEATISALRRIGYFQITDVAPARERDPLDRDNDGRKGSSVASEPEKRGPGRPKKAD